jgi:hypothetical protein
MLFAMLSNKKGYTKEQPTPQGLVMYNGEYETTTMIKHLCTKHYAILNISKTQR